MAAAVQINPQRIKDRWGTKAYADFQRGYTEMGLKNTDEQNHYFGQKADNSAEAPVQAGINPLGYALPRNKRGDIGNVTFDEFGRAVKSTQVGDGGSKPTEPGA